MHRVTFYSLYYTCLKVLKKTKAIVRLLSNRNDEKLI